VPPRIDVCPELCTPELHRALESHGLEPGGFPYFSRRVLLGPTRAAADDVAGVRTRRVELAEIDAFVAIQLGVWPGDEAERQRTLRHAHATPARPHRYRYVAPIGDSVAAVAAMDLWDGIAYLYLAVTREEFRGRGCQTALLRRRLADAQADGAELAFALVSPGSGSQRNIERAGLGVAYDRELWLRPDWFEHPFYWDAG
jgi:hypothetical protein